MSSTRWRKRTLDSSPFRHASKLQRHTEHLLLKLNSWVTRAAFLHPRDWKLSGAPASLPEQPQCTPIPHQTPAPVPLAPLHCSPVRWRPRVCWDPVQHGQLPAHSLVHTWGSKASSKAENTSPWAHSEGAKLEKGGGGREWVSMCPREGVEYHPLSQNQSSCGLCALE